MNLKNKKFTFDKKKGELIRQSIADFKNDTLKLIAAETNIGGYTHSKYTYWDRY